MSYREIQEDMQDYDDGGGFVLHHEKTEKVEWVLPELPGECVNLKSQVQLDYYKGNKIVQLAKQVC